MMCAWKKQQSRPKSRRAGCDDLVRLRKAGNGRTMVGAPAFAFTRIDKAQSSRDVIVTQCAVVMCVRQITTVFPCDEMMNRNAIVAKRGFAVWLLE